jgi:hypothetical protein
MSKSLLIISVILILALGFYIYRKNYLHNENFTITPDPTPKYNPQCDPISGYIPTSLATVQSAFNSLTSSITADKAYYDAICNKGQTSCDVYNPQLQDCYNKNGRDSQLCKNIMPSCVQPPNGLKLLDCNGIQNVINANIQLNKRNQTNLESLECENCTYCAHPGDVSLCNSICGNSSSQSNPTTTATSTTTATATATATLSPIPTLQSVSTNPTHSTNNKYNYETDSMNSNYTNASGSSISSQQSPQPQPTYGTSSSYAVTSNYPFTLNSTDMTSTTIFDGIDALMAFDNSALTIPTLNPNIYNSAEVSNSATYDNITSSSISNYDIQTQLLNQMQQASAPAIPYMSSASYPSSSSINYSIQPTIVNPTVAPPGIYQDHISGVSNVFAPTIIFQPI